MKKLLLIPFILLGFATQAQNIITTIAGNGLQGYSGDGGQATVAELDGPSAISFDAVGNLYIADGNGTYNIVRKISTSGIITTIAGNGTAGYSGDGGQATLAQLNGPEGLVFDAVGNLYVADEQNNVIRKVNTAGIITTVVGNGVGAGLGTGGYSGDGGQATNAELFNPIGIAFDAHNNLYISDNNNVVRKINTAGVITTIAGNYSLGGGYSGDGGFATAAALNVPYGITFDNKGNMYIGDYYNYRIRKIDTSGIITSIVGCGIAGYSGDGGVATLSDLHSPTGVSFDNSGNLYIADEVNGCIRKVSNIATTGINQVSITNYQLSVYPNPTKDMLNVEGLMLNENTELKMINILGEEVPIPNPSKREGSSISIDVSKLASGIYFLNIITDTKENTFKIIINQ